MHTRYSEISNYITKDGSIIRELMHPLQHGNLNQSLAEATVPVGVITHLHLHKCSEEIYHITKGNGEMTLGDMNFSVSVGDTICIPANTAHQIKNTGHTNLVILCVCSPAYSHDDTALVD